MNALQRIPSGTGGRWAIGVIVLTHLIAYDETGGPGAVFATIAAALSAIFSGICKSGTKQLQIPYIRTSHRFDFLCLFLAMWMDILSLLSACGALARTLSTCLDAMTGGLARIWILGRNSPANEPWPDVLGVAIIFLVTGMFMLGLENTRIFSFLMVTGVLGLSGILSIATWLRGNSNAWSKTLLPAGFNSIISGSAILTFSYPCEFPSTEKFKKITGIAIIFVVFLSNILTTGCLSTLFQFKQEKDFVAVPILSIVGNNNLDKIVPAVACLLVLGCSGSILELFPELYGLIVKLTTSEWKILIKQIGYENRDSGSPVLAVFTAGSLCAMLAFACPLEILTHILGASYLSGTLFRGFYLLYSPYRPKYIRQQNDSSLAYSRLNTGYVTAESNATTVGRLKGRLSFFSKSSQSVNQIVKIAIPKSKSKINKTHNDEELEREWLLLGEPPSSPRATNSQSMQDCESSILSDADQQQSDIDCIVKNEISDSESSTDIDAIVDEYRQKIKVSTAGPSENLKIPTNFTWHLSICGVILVMAGIGSTIIGIVFESNPTIIAGIISSFVISFLMVWLPKYQSPNNYTPSSILCMLSLFMGSVLLFFVLTLSWPAIIFWFISGLILFIRCDKICCSCLDRPIETINQNLIPNVSSSKLTTIRVARPLKNCAVTNGLINSAPR